eukprot:scaffold277540_cov36-Tisochrysis_lutea.AAC.1
MKDNFPITHDDFDGIAMDSWVVLIIDDGAWALWAGSTSSSARCARPRRASRDFANGVALCAQSYKPVCWLGHNIL